MHFLFQEKENSLTQKDYQLHNWTIIFLENKFDDDDGLFKLHIIAYKMKYNVFTINKIIYYNCS